MPEVEILKSVVSFNRGVIDPTRPILVGGQPRGGTSAIVAILYKLGRNLPRDFDPGNLEPTIVVNPNAVGLLLNLFGKDKREAYVASVRESMRADIAAVPNLVWKDPKLGHYLEEAIEGLDNPTIVYVSRDLMTTMMAEANVIGGRLQRNPEELAVVSNIFHEMVHSMVGYFKLAFTKPNATLFFSYEKLLSFPERSIAELVDVLRLEPTEEQFRAAIELVRPEAKRPLNLVPQPR